MEVVPRHDHYASLAEVRAYCESWQIRSFERFQQIFFVNQARDPGQDFEKDGWFRFNLGEHERTKRVHCTDCNRLFVKSNKIWVCLDCYLDRLMMTEPCLGTEDRSFCSQGTLYMRQQSWWEKNGKKFPFMSLPTELREAVYSSLFTPDIDLWLRDVRLRPDSPWAELPWNRRRSFLRARDKCPGIGILFLSRQVFNEASHIFYRNVNFVVVSRNMLRLMQQRSAFSSIRNLTLDLKHFDYLQLFGLTPEEQVLTFGHDRFVNIPHEPPAEAMALRGIHLRLLRLNIQSPYSMSRDPRMELTYHNDIVSTILDSAWPCVRGHAVTLSGYADDRLVLNFRARVDVARKQYEAWFDDRQRWGPSPSTLQEYDEWAEEVDDGVPVDGEGRSSLPSEHQLLEEMSEKHRQILKEKEDANALMMIDDNEPYGF